MEFKSPRQILEESGAILQNDHFVLNSSLHSASYVNKDAVYANPETVSLLCEKIALLFEETQTEAVVGPAIGGVILAQWTALHLGRIQKREVTALYAEKENGGFVLKRGYDRLVAGKKVLIVEDIVTTGASIKKVIEAVKDNGGDVVGAVALCRRGPITAFDIGAPRVAYLATVSFETYEENECPLCARGVPVNTSVGKGAEFLANQKGAT